MTLSIVGNNFYINNKKIFLNSGEIHYFRIKRALWDKHLEAAKEAGLTTVSTYVPWAWHESEQGNFDFTGESCPEKDLKGWLNRCKELGLHCIVKPGPFILAEFRGAGLPDWFLETYRDKIKMRNSQGHIVPSDGVNLFNKQYLEKVTKWYDQVMPLIAKNEINVGGPVILMQVCNEIGVFSWLAKQADYGGSVQQRFITYLTSKFSDIDELNRLWNTNYSNFADIGLPPDGSLPYSSKNDRGRDYEWHMFWRTYYADYLKYLVKLIRERGVNVPLYHNLPGWIYGHGYEFPVNISMYEELFQNKSEILFGVDHIPEFLSYRNMHDDRIINDITYAMQGHKPLFAAEFQCGSREYHVVTNPREMELFYKASIAHGLKGWNYYMFSQGRNPERKGYSGDTFYWFNPLTAEAGKTGAFPLVKRMSRIINTLQKLILDATRQSDICVLFYPPYYATELERPISINCQLQFSASAIRRPAYFDGLLKALQVMNVDYDMMDLNSLSVEDLANYKQVWAFCTDEMNAAEQQKIVDYAISGGNLVIFPYLPDREMSQKPCSIVRDALGIYPSGIDNIDSPLIDIYHLKDIKCSNPQITYSDEAIKGAEIIARTLNGNICGFSKSLGKGSVIHLGTWIGFDTEGHKPVYKLLLKQAGAKLTNAWTDNDFITVRERFTEESSALLFVGNYYNEIQNANVSYTHPESGEIISIPYQMDSFRWPAFYAVLSPIHLEIDPGLFILHCTSDILSIDYKVDYIQLTLQGERDLDGEIVFEGKAIHKLMSVQINGQILEVKMDENKRIPLHYKHPLEEEITLILKFK